jgi:hypothetical protein
MNFIFENNYSICHELCKEIIEMYENESETKKNDSSIFSGINKDVRDSKQFNIPKNDKKWYKIEQFLYKELNNNLIKYLEKINCSNYEAEHNNGIDSSIFKNITLEIDSFLINRYEKNKGKYTYHEDFHINLKPLKYRVITFLWYLNSVDEGGETEFWDSYKIKPITGKLILFPSNWCFQHRGLIPKSDNKYIITGWFYVKQ